MTAAAVTVLSWHKWLGTRPHFPNIILSINRSINHTFL